MDELFAIQDLLLLQLKNKHIYQRNIFKQFYFDNGLNVIIGPRGVGKTTFLLDFIQKNGASDRTSLYVSADHIYFLTISLYELVDKLYKETQIRLLCVDEIHKHPNWQQQLKNITDIYLDFKIIFTGSSQMDLIHSTYDLSRRVTQYYLHGLSFREYLTIIHQKKLPILSLKELIENHEKLTEEITTTDMIKQLHDYFRTGYYPFFITFRDEIEKFQAIENITHKIIYEDIAAYHALKTPTLFVIEQLYKFVLSSAPGEINAYKLSSQLRKDFDSISTYLKYLQQAGLIRFLYTQKSGHAYLRNPIKMYPENSNLVYAAYMHISGDNLMGKVRETFALSHLQNAHYATYYSEQGDFFCDGFTLEIGGKNKTMPQINRIKNSYTLADGIYKGLGRKIPLYLLGFLY